LRAISFLWQKAKTQYFVALKPLKLDNCSALVFKSSIFSVSDLPTNAVVLFSLINFISLLSSSGSLRLLPPFFPTKIHWLCIKVIPWAFDSFGKNTVSQRLVLDSRIRNFLAAFLWEFSRANKQALYMNSFEYLGFLGPLFLFLPRIS